ncbi:MAG: peptidase M16 [Ignavibacteriales bacterium CG18_big_fil_WC_8_21_14_2_50_31_20]|nr:MAG: peptidase M16 [Ignavibacteriales bacterium CG18_big_fil_WC_8_21_14_2_50_31_20]
MIRKTISFVLLTSVLLFAQLDRTQKPKPGPAPEIKIGEYESFTLDNGLQVFVVENDKLPRVTVSLQLHREAIMENENTGYISIAGELLRAGTENKTKDELDEAIDFIGADISTSSTGIYGSSLSKHTDKLLALMSDVLLHPSFKEEELEKIKKQTISGLKAAKEQPSAIASNVRKVLLYGKDHPYGEIQTEETVANITAEMCKEYYNTYFHPNIAFLAIVGDITKDDAEELVKKYFSEWTAKEVPTFTYTDVSAPANNKIAFVDRANAVQSVVNITYPISLDKFGDDAIKASVMNYLLGGGVSGEFFQVLREEKGYTYGAYSSITGDKLVGNFTSACDARNEVTDSVIITFLDVMKKFRNEKVSEEKLQAAKNFLTGSFSRALESSQTVAGFALNIARYNLPSDYYQNYLKKLNSVTVNDIHESAQKYVNPENAHILIVGKGDDVLEGLVKLSGDNKVSFYDTYGNEYDPSANKAEEGVTAKSIIENYISAIGGREKVEKIKDKTTLITSKVQGMEIKLEIFNKAPNKYLQTMDAGMMKQKSVYDGVVGKVAAMGKEQILEGDYLENMKMEATLNLFLNYSAAGINAKLAGTDKVDGEDVYIVNLTLPNKDVWTHYYSKTSGLLVKESKSLKLPQGVMTQSSLYNDYKEVDGIKFPFKITQSVGPQSMELEVTSLKTNTGLEDSLFSTK